MGGYVDVGEEAVLTGLAVSQDSDAEVLSHFTTRPEVLVGRADVTPASVLGENCSQFGEVVGLKQGVGAVHLVEEPEQLLG
jgi:hypothetical protein